MEVTEMNVEMIIDEWRKEDLSKEDEINLFGEFVRQLPRNSYLASMLGDIKEEVFEQIRNDFGWVSFRERTKEIGLHRDAIIEMEAKKKQLADDIKQLERHRDALQNGVNEIRSTIRKYQAY